MATLKRRDTLRCRQEFMIVRKRCRRYVGERVVLQIADAPDCRLKVGIIVGRRYHKSAVVRNRAKRLFRESFRFIKNRMESPKWIVILPRKRMLNSNLHDVQPEIVRLLMKAGAIS